MLPFVQRLSSLLQPDSERRRLSLTASRGSAWLTHVEQQARSGVIRTPSIIGLTTAELISSAGTAMTWIAIPWFVLQATGSASRMGLVFAVEVAPTIVLGIPSGSIVQTFGPRRTMLVCDLARAPLLALIPLLYSHGTLTFEILLILVAAAGVFTAPYLACQRVILPSIVGESAAQVGQANTVVGGATTIGNLIGAPIGGLLIAAVGTMTVVWIDAASYLVAFLLVLLLVRTRHASGEDEMEPGVLAGLRYVARDPIIRGVSVVVLLSGFWYPILVVAVPAYAFAHGADPRVAGLLLFAFSIGTVVGSFVSYRALARVPPLRLARFALIWLAASLCVVAMNLPVAVMAVVLGLGALMVPSANAPAFTLLTLAPEGIRAKVTTAVLTLNTAVMPLGYLVGGLLISRLSLRTAFVAVGALAILTAMVFWRVSTHAEVLDPGLATVQA